MDKNRLHAGLIIIVPNVTAVRQRELFTAAPKHIGLRHPNISGCGIQPIPRSRRNIHRTESCTLNVPYQKHVNEMTSFVDSRLHSKAHLERRAHLRETTARTIRALHGSACSLQTIMTTHIAQLISGCRVFLCTDLTNPEPQVCEH